eukprot:1150198-Pelagomonas_calceolata.AAC.1
MGADSAGCLAQHELQIPEQGSFQNMSPYLFDPSIPDQVRRATPAALVLFWSLLALLTTADDPVPPHIGYA